MAAMLLESPVLESSGTACLGVSARTQGLDPRGSHAARVRGGAGLERSGLALVPDADHRALDAVGSAQDSPAGQLTWTPRGLAVMLTLIMGVMGTLAVTVVMAFLSYSNEPLEPVGHQAPAVVAPQVGRG